MSAILITGAAGYVGSRFARALSGDRGRYHAIVATDCPVIVFTSHTEAQGGLSTAKSSYPQAYTRQITQ